MSYATAIKCHLILGFVIAGSACGGASTPSEAWTPLAADATYAGLTRAEWAVRWGRWSYAPTRCEFNDLDADGSHCADYQADDDAFFLAGGAPGTVRTRCVVPAQRAIVLPLTAFLIDNAGVPAADQLSEAELRQQSEQVRATMSDLHLVVDGAEVSDLQTFVVEPTRFDYELPPEPNWYSCNAMPGVSGLVEPAFITGYFAVLPAPAAGTHELQYGGVVYFGDSPEANHVTTTFTVSAE